MKFYTEGGGGVGSARRMFPSQPPETIIANDRGEGGRMEDATTFGNITATKFMRIIEEECNSSGSSSIGNNSDAYADEDDGGDQDGDAQSPYKYDDNNPQKFSNASLDDAIKTLEEALPIRRGISTFYNGKSKSFACLAEILNSSAPLIKDISKPENAYTRKRRNLLSTNLMSQKKKNRAFELSNINNGRISKKPKATMLHFASEREDNDLQKNNLSAMRSFSMVSLHQCSSRFGISSTKIENC